MPKVKEYSAQLMRRTDDNFFESMDPAAAIDPNYDPIVLVTLELSLPFEDVVELRRYLVFYSHTSRLQPTTKYIVRRATAAHSKYQFETANRRPREYKYGDYSTENQTIWDGGGRVVGSEKIAVLRAASKGL